MKPMFLSRNEFYLHHVANYVILHCSNGNETTRLTLFNGSVAKNRLSLFVYVHLSHRYPLIGYKQK